MHVPGDDNLLLDESVQLALCVHLSKYTSNVISIQVDCIFSGGSQRSRVSYNQVAIRDATHIGYASKGRQRIGFMTDQISILVN